MTKVAKKNKKADQQKLMVRIVCGALCVVMVVTTLLAILPGTDLHAHDDTTYYINEDGSVVLADGTYVGMFDELFGSAEDEHDHEHTEDEQVEAEGEAVPEAEEPAVEGELAE